MDETLIDVSARAAMASADLKAALQQLGVWDEVAGLVEDVEVASFDQGLASGWDRCATAHHLPTD